MSFRSLVVALTVVIGLVLALTAGFAAARSAPPVANVAAPSDDAGALIGELVFQADLLAALDRLCPAGGAPAPDWHGALRQLLEQAFTPELRTLSRRLGDDAGAQVVSQRGGCHTPGYSAAYGESKDDYRVLLQRWRALGD